MKEAKEEGISSRRWRPKKRDSVDALPLDQTDSPRVCHRETGVWFIENLEEADEMHDIGNWWDVNVAATPEDRLARS